MTSGNGNSNSSQHNGESKPAQALVKSSILTHLIEGFVIQEGAEPFPVSTGALYSHSYTEHDRYTTGTVIRDYKNNTTTKQTFCSLLTLVWRSTLHNFVFNIIGRHKTC